MKHPLLLVLLLLSLAANAWLVFARTTGTSSGTSPALAGKSGTAPANRPAPAKSGQPDATATAAPRPFVWKNHGHSDAELRSLVADLRAAGFPPDIIVRFIAPLLRERTHATVAKMPFWKQVGFSKDYRDETQKAADELIRLQEELLGPDGSRAATLDPFQRQMQFGNLSTAKIDAFLRIDRDYQSMRSDLFNANGGVLSEDDVKARNDQMATLERERLADLAAALGPEDFAAYELRGSAAANNVMNALRNVTVTEEEYVALVAAQKVKDPNASMFRITNLDDPGSLERTYAFNDQVRALLGEERTHAYLQSADYTYKQAALFTANYPALTTSQTYALYRLQGEAQALASQMRTAANAARANGTTLNSAQFEGTVTDLNARLEALLGADAAKAYRAGGQGGVFNSLRPRSGTTPAPTNSTVQVIRVGG